MASEAFELVGYFQWNSGWDMWEQVADEFKDEDEAIIPCYRRARAATMGGSDD